MIKRFSRAKRKARSTRKEVNAGRDAPLGANRGAVVRSHRRPLQERWFAWRRHHSQSAADSLSKVLQQPLASAMTWLVLGIALALPTSLAIALNNLQDLSGRFDDPARISLFLEDQVTLEVATDLAQELRFEPEVATVELVDREQALIEFRDGSGLGELIDSLPQNPLPHLLVVTPSSDTPELVDKLRGRLNEFPWVDQLVVDAQWLERFQAMMQLGRQVVLLLTLVLLAAVVLVLGNTISLTIENRRQEIIIVKLVGGSDAFVRRPLLYTGLWYGLGGGIVAALLVLLATQALHGPVSNLASAYSSDFRIRGLGVFDSLQLVLSGAGMGLLGAWLASSRHIRNIEPV
ncbi:MAG: permease-like cell division protein FtsX [Pseudomonadota bacterium]